MEAPDDLPAPQRERWVQGIALLRDLSSTDDLKHGRLVAYGMEKFWELIVRREHQMFKVDGPAERRPQADEGRFTFDLAIIVDEIPVSLVYEFADDGIAGAHLQVPRMRVDEGICRPRVDEGPLEFHLTVDVAVRRD